MHRRLIRRCTLKPSGSQRERDGEIHTHDRQQDGGTKDRGGEGQTWKERQIHREKGSQLLGLICGPFHSRNMCSGEAATPSLATVPHTSHRVGTCCGEYAAGGKDASWYPLSPKPKPGLPQVLNGRTSGERKWDVFDFLRSHLFVDCTMDLSGLSRAVQPPMIVTLLASFRRETV